MAAARKLLRKAAKRAKLMAVDIETSYLAGEASVCHVHAGDLVDKWGIGPPGSPLVL